MEKLAGPLKPQKGQASGDNNGEPAPSSRSSTPAAPGASEAVPNPKITIRPSNQPSPASSENPFTKLGAHSANGASTPSVRTSSDAGSLKRLRTESDEQKPTDSPAPKTHKTPLDVDINTYESKILGHIFRITLEPHHRVDASGHKLIHLPNLKHELEEENAPIRLSTDRLDSALLEACSSIPHNRSVLDYLLPCWKRVVKAQKGLKGYTNGRDNVLKEAKRLCMSNCAFAVEVPELFRYVVCRTS
jgi:ubiquitin conjugation factor E4 B